MKLEGIYKLCTWRVRRQESVSDIHKEQQSWFPPYLGMMLHNKLINMDDFTCQPKFAFTISLAIDPPAVDPQAGPGAAAV